MGGYAVILHGYERVTADMDVCINATTENYRKLEQALSVFGMPAFDMSLKNFLDVDRWDVFRFGRKPVAIDIMTKVKGLNFQQAHDESEIRIVDGIPVRLIHYKHLIESKRKAGRSKDLNDLENLPL